MKPIKVKVKKDHIERGVPVNCCFCPVALAILEVIHAPISVTQWSISVGDSARYAPSAKVEKFIVEFDLGRKVRPFTFWLRDKDLFPPL